MAGKGKKQTFLRRIWKFIKRTLLVLFLLSIISSFLYKFIPPPATPLMVLRVVENIFDKDHPVRIEKKWMDIEDISPNLVKAAIAGEDQNFVKHWGFDFEAMKKAYSSNKKGKKIKGGSTISQQTAKNVFLWPDRTYVRKILEAYFTAIIELFWSKQRIMEVYLNVIEMGDGIYGCEQASQEYFHKSATKLTREEAAMLVAAFPNPRKWNPAKPTNYLKHKQGIILKHMQNLGKVEL